MARHAARHAAGKPIITKNVILDLKGVSMKNFGHAAREILTKIAAIDQVRAAARARAHPELSQWTGASAKNSQG